MDRYIHPRRHKARSANQKSIFSKNKMALRAMPAISSPRHRSPRTTGASRLLLQCGCRLERQNQRVIITAEPVPTSFSEGQSQLSKNKTALTAANITKHRLSSNSRASHHIGSCSRSILAIQNATPACSDNIPHHPTPTMHGLKRVVDQFELAANLLDEFD